MLEFTLLEEDSVNYNIIKLGVLAGNIDHVFLACGANLRGSRVDLPWLHWAAIDVLVNPINGNLLLRGP